MIIIGGEALSLLVAQQILKQDSAQRYRVLVLDSMPSGRASMADLTARQVSASRPRTSGASAKLTEAQIYLLDHNHEPPQKKGAAHFLEWAAASELPRERWPTELIKELNRTYFSQAVQQLGTSKTNNVSHSALQTMLRHRLFAGLAANQVTNIYPLAELPDHPVAQNGPHAAARPISKKRLHRLLGLPESDKDLSRGDLLNLLKLESGLVAEGFPTPHYPRDLRSPPPAQTGATSVASLGPGGWALMNQLKIIANCPVTRLLTTSTAGKTRVTGVQVRVDGIARTIPVPAQGIVVIGLDTIQSARLALLSFSALPNSNLIGRNLMSHLCSTLTIRLPPAAVPAARPAKASAAILSVKGRKKGLTGACHFLLQITATGLATSVPRNTTGRGTMLPDPDGLIAFPQEEPDTTVITIRGLGEMEPQNPVNRVMLDRHLDDDGLPRALVHLSPTIQDLELWDAMDQATDEVAQILAGGWPYEVLAGGQFQPVPMGQAAQAVLPFSERRRLDATHHEAGTLWMGDDPNTSVTNSKGRFHHITNAYALGPCLFPTIGARDPWLTSTALACCLVDHLLGRQTGPPAAAYHAGSPLCDNSCRMRTARARDE
jgi:choline dehydrogenase-like flavoprotein